MPKSNYSRKDSLHTRGEKLAAIHIYLFRKLVLYLIVANLKLVKTVSKNLGFDYTVSVSDREAWKWNVREKVPGVHAEARIER